MYIYTYIHLQTCIYRYIHIYVRTHIYIYIQVYTCTYRWSREISILNVRSGVCYVKSRCCAYGSSKYIYACVREIVCACVCVCVCVCMCVFFGGRVRERERVCARNDTNTICSVMNRVSYHTHGCVMSHQWMSHFTLMDESCHTTTRCLAMKSCAMHL